MRDPGAPFWIPSAALRRHANRTASGDPGVDWLSHVRARHFRVEPRRTLVVGSGEGFLELALARVPGAGAIAAVDADAASVERARRRAERRGLASISHAVLDPDAGPLPDGPWDAVFVQGVLHHAADPEKLLRRIHDGLSPSGRVVFADYAGPSRFQYPEARLAIVDRYFRLLPERLRRDPATGGTLRRRERFDPAALSRELPHEAERSAELVSVARRVFFEEAVYGGGGGLLHPLLSGLEPNFGKDAAGEERLLEVLCAAEAHLASRGLVPDDFVVFVGRRRSADG